MLAIHVYLNKLREYLNNNFELINIIHVTKLGKVKLLYVDMESYKKKRLAELYS
jgi:hypothetical protein